MVLNFEVQEAGKKSFVELADSLGVSVAHAQNGLGERFSIVLATDLMLVIIVRVRELGVDLLILHSLQETWAAL